MTSPRTVGGNLPRLTSLRFFAAALILVFHARLIHIVPGGRLFDLAHMGVAFFFVLSGFVLTWASPGERVEPRRFWLNRFARIYPSHIVTLVVSLFIMPITYWWLIPLDAFLLQAWAPYERIAVSLNAVSWSLSAEAFFYFLAPWLITTLRRRSPRTLVVVAVTWLVITMALGRAVTLMGYAEWPYFMPLARSSEFVIGVVLAELFCRGHLRKYTPPVQVCVLACVASYALAMVVRNAGVTMKMAASFISLPAICALVVSSALADVRGRPGPLASPLLEHAGRVSFALYLVHYMVIAVTNDLMDKYLPGTKLGIPLRLGLLAAVCVVSWICAEALHRGVEIPAQRLIRSAYARRRARART